MDYAVAPMSQAHTFGNMTAFVTQFVKGLFPPNYFKTVNISSTIAYRQFNILDSTNKEFLKKNKPMLIIRPRVNFDNDSDMFLNGTLFTSRITDAFVDLDVGNLQPFLSDKERGNHIRYLLNRIRMFFDVTIIMESQMEQLNQMMYLRNRIRPEHPFNMNVALESQIPHSIVKAMVNEIGLNIDDPKTILEYMNGKSDSPVTFKLKNSTGNDEYFRYYVSTVDTMFTGLDIDDGERRGFVNSAYAINFTINTEFNTAGLYYYFTRQPEVIEQVEFSMMADNSIIPVFTVTNMYDIQPPNGWNLYTNPMYRVETSRAPDHMDISSLLNKSLLAAIQHHIDHSLPFEPLLKVFVMKDNEQLVEGTDFTVDFTKLELITIKVNTASTYRLMIYVNTLYVNELIGTIYEVGRER